MLSYTRKAFPGNAICKTKYRCIIVLIVMHRSAVARSFCSSITWPENNRECLLIKAASLKLWLAAPDGWLCCWNPWEAAVCPKESTVSPGTFTCFKVWLGSKSSVYPLCFCLCTTSGLCKLEVSRGRRHQSQSSVCEVTGKLLRQAQQKGWCQTWMLRNAGGMPELNYPCKWINLPLPKGTLPALWGVAGCDQ